MRIHGRGQIFSNRGIKYERTSSASSISSLFRCSHIMLCRTPTPHPQRYTLLKSDVTRRDHMVRCHRSQECGSRFVNFDCQFHSRLHSLRITLKSTTLVCMRSSNAWTTKPWQRSEWRLGFNSVLGARLGCDCFIMHLYMTRTSTINIPVSYFIYIIPFSPNYFLHGIITQLYLDA